MKNNKLQMLFAGLFLCAAAIPAFAEEKTSEEKKLETSAVELDKSAAEPEGQPRVTAKIQTRFGVDGARVQGLRDKKLGYGEISIALGLAQGLPGGITDANVDKIMALRQGPPVMGWGKIAKDLGLKLGSVQSKVKKLAAEVRKEEGRAKKAAEKAMKAEKREKHEKVERPQKPEKGGKR